MAIAFSAMSIGEMSSLAPNYGAGRLAASNIFYIHDQEPNINPTSQEGQRVVGRDVRGNPLINQNHLHSH